MRQRDGLCLRGYTSGENGMLRDNDCVYEAEDCLWAKVSVKRVSVSRMFGGLIACSFIIAAMGCVTVVMAPGADQVRLTSDAASVSGCTPVGNIAPLLNEQTVSMARAVFRNRVVGLGGNAGFITKRILNAPIEGIAYRSPPMDKSAVQ